MTPNDSDGPNLHRDPDMAADMAVNAVCLYLDESGIQDRAARHQWITLVFARVIAKELAY